MNEIKINGIKITNPKKQMSGKITKLDIINYYKNVSNLMLPFLSDRYVSEVRCHNELKHCYFKKHNENNNKLIKIEDKKTLILNVQLGTIEYHIYGKSNKNSCNIMVFDLDPDENLSIKVLRKGVKLVKQTLDELNLISFLKTSGGKGYHIVLPFKKCTMQKFESFAKNFALLIEIKYSNIFTTSISKKDRKNKIFIDYLRNKKNATCVAPYSLRARENIPISFPINWGQLDIITPNKVTIKNYKKYLQKDAWKDFFNAMQELNAKK